MEKMSAEEYMRKHVGIYNLDDEINERVIAAMEEYAESMNTPVSTEEVVKLKKNRMSIVAIAKTLGVSRQTVYRHLEKAKNKEI